MKRLYLGFDVSWVQIGAALDISRIRVGAVYLIAHLTRRQDRAKRRQYREPSTYTS